MGQDTGIDYLDASWNPIVGCTRCSVGCQNCWAEKFAKRLRANKKAKYPDVISTKGHWNGKTFLRYKSVADPKHWKTPKRIGVCFMGDMFHDSVGTWTQQLVMRVIWECRDRHTFLILTKRPENAARFFCAFKPHDTDPWPWPHVWIGTSVENQSMADLRIPALAMIPAAVRFLSIEPILSRVTTQSVRGSASIDWIIAGCESINGKPGRHAPHFLFEEIVNEAQCMGVPLFIKQWEIDNKIVHTPAVLGKPWTETPTFDKELPHENLSCVAV